ncbi:MAG: division/cell wall cluster transcriptional repressor MraZ [Bacteroidota bacterium]
MFAGEFQHALDDKGRVTIPAKFREGLGEGFMITRGLDRCLFAYPREEWARLEEKVKTLPTAQTEVRAFVRLLFSGAVEAEVDKQGRVGLPQHLRTYAGIERDAVIIGVSNRVEIWSAEIWASYAEKAEASFSEMAENVGLGI